MDWTSSHPDAQWSPFIGPVADLQSCCPATDLQSCRPEVIFRWPCFCQRLPKDPGLRKAWAITVRERDFAPNDTTVLCSCHFKADDFDRTGQIVHVKECMIPSDFASFSDHLNKVGVFSSHKIMVFFVVNSFNIQ